MASRESRGVVAERPRSRSSTNGVVHEVPEPEGLQEPKGLLSHEWEEVRLEDVDFADQTFQYRLSFAIADVKASLAREGQETPIDVTGRAPHRIIDGFRRAAAARDLGWSSIKAFVHRGMSDEEAFRLAFTKNVVRKNLTPVEKAHAMFLARQRGIEKEKLCDAFGLSQKQVERYLELAEFPDSIKAVLDGLTVTMAHARLLNEFKVRDAEGWAKRIETERLDARTLRRLLAQKIERKRMAGRRKRFVWMGTNAIRFYPVKLSSASSEAERERLVGVLEATIKVIKSW